MNLLVADVVDLVPEEQQPEFPTALCGPLPAHATISCGSLLHQPCIVVHHLEGWLEWLLLGGGAGSVEWWEEAEGECELGCHLVHG